MARDFKEPATTWRGAILRAAGWAGPQLCGAFVLGSLLDRPLREWVMYGTMLGVIPVVLAVRYRSWRVGLASAGIAAGVVAAAFAAVLAIIRSAV